MLARWPLGRRIWKGHGLNGVVGEAVAGGLVRESESAIEGVVGGTGWWRRVLDKATGMPIGCRVDHRSAEGLCERADVRVARLAQGVPSFGHPC